MPGVTMANIFYYTDKMRFPIAHGRKRHLVTPIQIKPNVSLCSCIEQACTGLGTNGTRYDIETLKLQV